jgi:hypothetical protein
VHYVFIDSGRNGILLRVLTVLEDVKETLRVQGSMLASIMRQLSTDKEIPVLPDGVYFPIQSEAAFDEFEKIATDTSVQKALVSSMIILISLYCKVFLSNEYFRRCSDHT